MAILVACVATLVACVATLVACVATLVACIATLVACIAETSRWSVGCEFRRQVMFLFLRLLLSSCVVIKFVTL